MLIVSVVCIVALITTKKITFWDGEKKNSKLGPIYSGRNRIIIKNLQFVHAQLLDPSVQYAASHNS